LTEPDIHVYRSIEETDIITMTFAEKEKDDTVVEQYSSSTATINESVDCWRYDIGVNVIPADTINISIMV
jgi:hypothetical protein